MSDIQKHTILSLENYGNKITWETDHSDVTLTELFDAFRGLLVGITFTDQQILEGMREYAEERLPDDDELGDEY